MVTSSKPHGARQPPLAAHENTGGTLNITVTAERTEADKVVAQITVAAADVDKAIDKTYKDIAYRYNFQGFRRGRTPRPVIDGIIGKEAVLAQATNDLLNDLQPQVLDELDLVPMDQPSFGDDPALLVQGTDYQVEMTVDVMPECELDDYDAPAINMPPEEATEAEIDQQIEQLLSYQTTFEDDDTDRPCEEGDVVACDIADKEGAAHLAGKNRTLSLNPMGAGVPEELVQGIVGMKAGETKEISWTHSHTHEDEVHEHTFTVEVTLNSIKKAVTPELTDELAKNSFGFDTIAELRDAVKEEIEEDKVRSLPRLKEDRAVEALGERLQLEEVPEPFLNQVMNELANEFLQQLQRQGMSLDMYLGARGMKTEDFMGDLRRQAMDRARQSVALDALAKKLGLVATSDDVRAEVEKAGVEDVDGMVEQLTTEGRLPSIREAIRRSKAVDWLVEHAPVTIVDEIAERRGASDADEAAPEAKAAEAEEADAE